MNLVAMDGNDRANANTNRNNGGGEDNSNYRSNNWCSPSTIESAGEAALQFPSSIPAAAVTIPHTGYATMLSPKNNAIHTKRREADPHPYSKSHATTTETPYHSNKDNAGYKVPRQSKKGAFVSASIGLEDLRIGYNTHTAPSASASNVGTKAGGTVGPSLPLALPTTLPAPERRSSPTQQQYYGKQSSHNSNNYDYDYNNYNNYHISPHRRITNKHKYDYGQQAKQPWEEEHRQLKKLLPDYVSKPIEKHNSNAKKKPPQYASSLQTMLNQHQRQLQRQHQHQRQRQHRHRHRHHQELSQHRDSQHRSRDLKPPPPPSSPPLLSKQQSLQEQTTKEHREHFGVRNNNDDRSLSRPARTPSVPRAIDVDMSYSNHSYFPNKSTNDGISSSNCQHRHSAAAAAAALPPLSPISFSSSMFLKRTPIGSNNDNYVLYPSKDAIEEQLSEYENLPPYPIDAVFPTNSAAAASTATTIVNATTTSNSNVATANATSSNFTSSTTSNSTTTETPLFSEGNTTNALNKTAVFKNRPEKPMRINSHFPSQLQLQKQRQQELQDQHQQQQQQQHQQELQQQHQHHYQHPSNPRNNQSAHRPPEIDVTQHSVPSIRPLPIGNGITNGIATGIDATKAASRRQRQGAFVPLTHNYQEFDLQLSSPATTTTTISSTPRPITDPQTPTNQQQQPQPPQFQASNNAQGVIRHHRDNDSSIENDSSEPSNSSHSLPGVKVEIYPGVSHILRGAEETAKAAKRNFVEGCTCLACTAEYSCIADAAFVICPACFVVNPVEGPRNKSNYNDIHAKTNTTAGGGRNIQRWGVGLGFYSDNDKGEYFWRR